MIPKVIHYCWFGKKPLSAQIVKNIKSWKKYCPDYKIIQWNESNFDIRKYRFAYEAYKSKNWAFVTDVARLDIVYHEGGFYLDTDVELLNSLDKFVDNKVFVAREDKRTVNTGIGFGAESHNDFVLKNLLEYRGRNFVNKNGSLNKILCVDITTHLLRLMGLKTSNKIQVIDQIKIYPREYFCPVRIGSGRKVVTKNTVAIHHYNASWKNKNASVKRLLIPLKKVIKYYVDKLFGFGTYNNIKYYFKK